MAMWRSRRPPRQPPGYRAGGSSGGGGNNPLSDDEAEFFDAASESVSDAGLLSPPAAGAGGGSGGLSRVGSRGAGVGVGPSAASVSLATLAALDAQLPPRLWGWGLIEEFSAAAAVGDDMPAPIVVASEREAASAASAPGEALSPPEARANGIGSPPAAERMSSPADAASAAAGYGASDMQLVRLYYGAWQVRVLVSSKRRPLWPADPIVRTSLFF